MPRKRNRYQKYILPFLFCFIIIGLTLALGAQDESEVTPEATAEPLIEATVEPTLPPVEVTEEPTIEVQPTEEAPPTEEVTPTEEAPPVIQPPVASFVDDFQDGDLAGWATSPGWQIGAEGDNRFLSASAANETATIIGIDWPHLLLSANIRLAAESAAGVVLRSGAENYTVGLESSGRVSLYRSGVLLTEGAVPAANDSVDTAGWRTISIQALGKLITVAVDGVVQFSYADASPLDTGAVGFISGGAADLDDVSVIRLDAPIETEPTEEVTTEPTEEPVIDNFDSEPPLTLVFSADFNKGLNAGWVVNAPWTLVASEDGQALQISGADDIVEIPYQPAINAAIQARFQFDSGAAQIGLQRSPAGVYTVSVSGGGEVWLWRGDALFASAVVAPVQPGQWRTVRFSSMSGVLRVAVDGVNVIAVRDYAPLPPGTAFVGADSMEAGTLTVDDVELWVPSSEYAVETEPVEVTATPYPQKERPQGSAAGSELEMTPTDYWAVVLQPGTDAEAVAQQLGFEYVGPVASLPDTYLFRKPNSDAAPELAGAASDTLAAASSITWFEQQFNKQAQTRSGLSQETIPVWEDPEIPVDVLEPGVVTGEEVLEPDLSPEPDAPASIPRGEIIAQAGIVDPSAPQDAQGVEASGSGFLGQAFSFELNGDVVAAGRGMRGKGQGVITISGIPADAIVQRAFLYWTVLGHSNTFTNVQLNGLSVTGSAIGTSGGTCWGGGSNFAYRADVTGHILGNGSYYVSGLPAVLPPLAPGSLVSTSANDTQGATLVVVYRSPSKPHRRIIINDGAITVNTLNASMFNSLSGFTAASPSDAKLILVVGDGQPGTLARDGTTYFNGRALASNPWSGSNGPLWDTRTYNVSRFAPITSPVTVQISGTNDCLVWNVNILSISTPWHTLDPQYPSQWHLKNTGQFGGSAGKDVNVIPAWAAGYDGTGVVINIVDDGLQYDHPDLSPNYWAVPSTDINGGDAFPYPSASNPHGTSAAGVAAAADEGTCGVGAAYNAILAGVRLIAASTNDSQDAAGLSFRNDLSDIYSNSWGPPDNGAYLGWDGPSPGQAAGWNSPLALAAIFNSVYNGRGGYGNIYMWAAGNGRDNIDDINADHFANSRYTIAVGAYDNKGKVSWYSEPGAAMHVTAPSNGGSAGIFTTDLLGASGYNGLADLRCTNAFGGTSSATPLASGVVALMLDANYFLNWRDVQHILARTATKVDPTNSDWRTNGAGFRINHNYGFGAVNAAAAVQLARTWQNVPAEYSDTSGVQVVNTAIPDNNATGVVRTFTYTGPANFILEHVEVVMNITHTWRGDLEVILTSPRGTPSTLMRRRPNDNSSDGFPNWQFMTVRNWGENPNGTWRIQMRDRVGLDVGVFQNYQIILHGYLRPTRPTSAPVLVSPANNAILTNTLGTLSWNPVLNATGYLVEVDTESSFKNPVFSVSTSNTSILFSLPTRKYFWRVRARNFNEFGPPSVVRSFTIDTAGPQAPQLKTPTFGALVTAFRPTLTWAAAAGASRYRLQVDDNSDFSSPLVDAFPIAGTAYMLPTPLTPGVYYYWRVQSIDSVGNAGAFSPVFWFRKSL